MAVPGAIAGRRLLMATIADLGARNGPAVHVLNLARGFDRLGLDVTLLTRPPGGPLPDLAATRIKVWTAGFGPDRAWPGAASVPALAQAIWHMPPPDAVFLRSGIGTWPLASLARRWPGVPLVVDCNGWFRADLELIGRGGITAAIAHRLQLREARLATHLRVVTQNLADRFASAGIPSAKLAVIGNGADTEIFRPLDRAACRRALGLAPRLPLLALVSNLWPAIDLPVVFQAMRVLVARGRPVELAIAGDGVARAAFEAAARENLGAEPAVHWLGAVVQARANELLGAADAVLAPFVANRNAVTGLSPLKLREAAAAGRPCVATALPGIAEFAGETWMFLAEAGDAASYADAIERALAADAAHVGAAARRYAEQHFAWSVIVDQIAALLFPAFTKPGDAP